jgi:adenylate kinase family enzyme
MYNRISIVGGPGSGKSTLCNILSKELNLPAIHLDAINFNSNWVEIDKEERDKIISNKASENKWIIDGNYNKTLKERLAKADLIIWLDYSTLMQLKGVLKRFLKTRNTERPEIPGCKERLNFTFIKYVLAYNKKKRPIIVDYLKDVPKEKVLIFKKQKDLNVWLKEFTHNDNVLEGLTKMVKNNKFC